MNVFELRIPGTESESRLWAARWALFVCPEIRDVNRTGATDEVAILCEDAQPDFSHWLEVLDEAGYPSQLVGAEAS